MAAPSKLLRPSGEWVKTDRRYAILLARLARNNDIVAVRVPTRSREGARDLVRSRADARGDLMTARHRLSKMLLRRGIVYDGARTWTRIHDAWLQRVRRDHVIGVGPSALAAFDDAYDTVVHATARRDRLDEALAGLYHDGELRPHRQASGLSSWCQRPDRGVTGRRDRRLEPLQGLHHRLLLLPRPPLRALLGHQPVPGPHHEDRQHPRPAPADRGRLAPRPRLPALQGHTGTGPWPPYRSRNGPMPATAACTPATRP